MAPEGAKPMKRIAYIARTGEEELARMAHFMDRNGILLEGLGLDETGPHQYDLSGYDGVVILGDPQGGQRQAFRDRIMDSVREAVDKNIPVLGISAGARLLAEICRDSVDAGVPGKAVWSRFRLSEEGRKDIIFFGVSESFSVIREYGDAFIVPSGSATLAVSDRGTTAAFRYHNAYGLEFTPLLRGSLSGVSVSDQTNISPVDEPALQELLSLGRTIFGNFLWLIEVRCSSKTVRRGDAAEPAAT